MSWLWRNSPNKQYGTQKFKVPFSVDCSDEYDDSPPVLTPEANGPAGEEAEEMTDNEDQVAEGEVYDGNDAQGVEKSIDTSGETRGEGEAGTQEVSEDLEEGELEEGEIVDDEGEVPAADKEESVEPPATGAEEKQIASSDGERSTKS